VGILDGRACSIEVRVSDHTAEVDGKARKLSSTTEPSDLNRIGYGAKLSIGEMASPRPSADKAANNIQPSLPVHGDARATARWAFAYIF